MIPGSAQVSIPAPDLRILNFHKRPLPPSSGRVLARFAVEFCQVPCVIEGWELSRSPHSRRLFVTPPKCRSNQIVKFDDQTFYRVRDEILRQLEAYLGIRQRVRNLRFEQSADGASHDGRNGMR